MHAIQRQRSPAKPARSHRQPKGDERATRPAGPNPLWSRLATRSGPLAEPVHSYFEPRLQRKEEPGVDADPSSETKERRSRLRRRGMLSYRESKNLADCVRIMGPESRAYCRATVLGEPMPRVEDWDFTPAEHAALKKSGGALKFAAGSDWFPDPLKKNLLATLDKLLDPNLKDVTKGVNVKDLYHGHVVIPLGKTRSVVRDAVAAFGAEFQKAYATALGGHWTNAVTDANLAAFAKALTDIQPSAQKLLELALQVKETAVLYHTMESGWPSWMDPGDPLRNWLTPLATNKPAGYTPPDKKKAGSYDRDFFTVLHFAFLIDGDGVIHLRHGSTRELSTVTGKP